MRQERVKSRINKSVSFNSRNSQMIESCVFGVASSPDRTTAAIQLTDGSVLQYTLGMYGVKQNKYPLWVTGLKF